MAGFYVGDDVYYFVRLEDAAGDNAPGIANTVATAVITKMGAVGTTLDLTGSTVWVEDTTGGTGKGGYWVKAKASLNYSDTAGKLVLSLTYLGKTTHYEEWLSPVAEKQTGDSFARVGALGAGLTALAPAATALDNTVWTNAKAAFLTGDAFVRLGAPAGASLAADLAAVFAREGAPAGASLAADIAAVLTSVGLRLPTSSYTAPDNTGIGVAAAAASSAASSAATAATNTATIVTAQIRMLGLLRENTVEDVCVYDSNGDLTSARMRSYDTAAHADAARADAITNPGGTFKTGKLNEWLLTATYAAKHKIQTIELALVS